MLPRLLLVTVAFAALARGAAPLTPGTGVPWLHERPSEGLAIWDGSSSGAALSMEEMTLCVIRVDFIEDFTPLTTGSGHFDTDAQPPHDTEYTVSLMEDLASWLSDVSGGAFVLSFEVYPAERAYRLPRQMSWYGADSSWMQGSCELLRDAVESADYDVDFSGFQAVLVVHAGAGQEADVAGNSPDDMNSLFLTLGDLASYLPEGGIGFPGIATDDGVFVREGMIVPEQETQDGYGLGVLGTMVHEFMHQLGLPDLYDTITGGVGVGGWDIMGYGQWMMNGFWPTGPGAWSRVMLGWTDFEIASGGGTWDLTPEGAVLKVPLSGSEYLLVENRLRDPDGNGLCGGHERDFALPGSGILIWHIDAGVLSSNLSANTVNADPEHKGVDLEEADGIQDFDYSLPDIYGIMGSEFDPFFAGGYSSRFGPSTIPSSVTSWGGSTGVAVEVGSAPGRTMSVAVQSGGMAEGWPVQMGPLSAGPFLWDAQEGKLLLFRSTTGYLWKIDLSDPGTPYTSIAGGTSGPPAAAPLSGGLDNLVWIGTDGEVHLLDPSRKEMPGWPVRVGGIPLHCAAISDLGAVLVSTDRKQVHLFDVSGDEVAGWPVSISEIPAGMAVFPRGGSEAFIAVTTASGRTHLFDESGIVSSGWPVEAPGGAPVSAPLIADLDRDGSVELVILCGSRISCFGIDGSVEAGFPVSTRAEPMGSPWLCDPDSDGLIDIAVETAAGLEIFEASGFPLLDWPELSEGDPSGTRSDAGSGVGGTGFVAHFLRDGRLFLRGATGEPAQGFPLSVGDSPMGRPLFIDHDGDGLYSLAACDKFGWVGFWDGVMPVANWFPGLDYSGSNCWPTSFLPAIQSGSEEIAEGSFFVYPNPVSEGSGRIRFESGRDDDYSIRVFNVAGELVSSFDGSCRAGLACEVEWETENLSPGIYFICLRIGSTEELFHAAVAGLDRRN